MSNNVKKILGLALAFNIITSVAPTTLSISQTKAYAANSEYVLTNLDISSINGSSLNLYDDKKCKSKDKISDSDLDDTKTIYSKISSGKKGIEIDDVKASNGKVEIYVSGKKIDDDDEIKISKGSSKTITFKIVDENGKEQNKYTLKVSREGESDDDDDDDDKGDDVYLSSLTLYYNWKDLDLNFKKNTKTYNITVDKDVTFLRIEAEPDDNDYKVSVNGEAVHEDDDWQIKVGIKEGKNEIKIKVRDEDDENERTYTVNVTRPSSDGKVNNNTSNNNSASNSKNSGWKYTNGKWQYYDVNGNQSKNAWVTDAKGKSYYLGSDGNMATGWVTLNGNQYYFDLVSGERKTGWICLGKTWYQLDGRGVLVK